MRWSRQRSAISGWQLAKSLAPAILIGLIAAAAMLLRAAPADDKRMSVYEPGVTYGVNVVDVDGAQYIGLVDLFDPLGKVESRVDGNRVKMRFTAPHDGKPQDSEFENGRNSAKLGRTKVQLGANFVVRDGRGLLPISAVASVVTQLAGVQVEFHEASRRLFLGGTGLRFGMELQKGTPSKLVLRFPAPVNPTIATEPGKVRMVFSRDPVLSSGSDTLSFSDPTITSGTFAENNGSAELTVNGSVPLMANFSDGGKTITIAAAPGATVAQPQSSAQPMPTGTSNAAPGTPIQGTVAPIQLPPEFVPGQVKFLVVVDASHGGDERGAALTNTLQEKDVTLSIARRITAQLQAKGITAILLRSADNATTLEQRAETANAMRPALFLTVHAATLGRGVRLYTAMMPASNAQKPAFLPWESAQASFLDASAAAVGSIAAEFNSQQIPVRALTAAMRPLNNIAAAAIAVEVAPPDEVADNLNSATYQQNVATAVASGVAAARAKLEAAR